MVTRTSRAARVQPLHVKDSCSCFQIEIAARTAVKLVLQEEKGVSWNYPASNPTTLMSSNPPYLHYDTTAVDDVPIVESSSLPLLKNSYVVSSRSNRLSNRLRFCCAADEDEKDEDGGECTLEASMLPLPTNCSPKAQVVISKSASTWWLSKTRKSHRPCVVSWRISQVILLSGLT